MARVGRGRAGGGQGEIFPALGEFVGIGMAAGAMATFLIAELAGWGGGASVRFALGTALGAILGLFAGLGGAVWRRGQPLPAPAPEPGAAHAARGPAPQLWDPWLDSGRDAEWVVPEVEPEPPAVAEEPSVAEGPPVVVEGDEGPAPGRAPVRPRVVSPETGEAGPLEDEIGPMIQAGRRGLVAITGGPGSGKSTALRHLAAVLPPWARDRVQLLDATADDLAALEAAAVTSHLVIVAPQTSSPLNRRMAAYRLAPWSQDDLIEYLLAVHRESCASVMGRLKESGDRDFLEGIPELWAIVLDRMAGDESIGDVRTALERELAARIGNDPALREHIQDSCLEAIRRNTGPVLNLPTWEPLGGRWISAPSGADPARLVRHRPAALLLAADRIAAIVVSGRARMVLANRYPRALVQEAARRIAGDARALQSLNEWVGRGDRRAVHPLAASLLHAAMPGWRPNLIRPPRLEGAYLDRVAWSGLYLAAADLRETELRGADLSRSYQKRAHADRAQLQRANLRGASLVQWRAEGADLSGADLRDVHAESARLRGAKLAGASWIGANLWKADLREADIEDADFTGANLQEARLSGLKLRLARFDRAVFGGADLSRCDLEDVVLGPADFADASLRGALLTGSRMPGANFLGSDLRETGLAEVDWPGVCLRDADLRGATFHLGSSRNGLVGSPIACEGSRTGFYTDDYHDQDIKPAEEICKANLRGADLRGAEIEGVDFYLVDLRDAQYTPDQAEHLRRCRAILEDRTA
jgi:uncharacterized protein YjbI with pentapeptide repeats